MSSKKADTEVWRCQLLSTLIWWGSELGQIWLTFMLTPIYSGQKNKQVCLSYLFLAFFVRPVQLEFFEVHVYVQKILSKRNVFQSNLLFLAKKMHQIHYLRWIASFFLVSRCRREKSSREQDESSGCWEKNQHRSHGWRTLLIQFRSPKFQGTNNASDVIHTRVKWKGAFRKSETSQSGLVLDNKSVLPSTTTNSHRFWIQGQHSLCSVQASQRQQSQ